MIAPDDRRTAPTIVDPDLGKVRWCRRCKEWWPLDDEFWYTEPTEGHRALHCRACKADRLIHDTPHTCARCGVVKTRHELCHGCAGRTVGPLTVAMLERAGLAPRSEAAA